MPYHPGWAISWTRPEAFARATRNGPCRTPAGILGAGRQNFEALSGGQQARFQVLLLELAGTTMLLLDEPTDNLALISAEA
ncbi:hypothetical protein [Streptomyces sp. NRRL S-241]|uniref:hypothetical protein n=1 Tax=Streptomyces sp. NRRL S-241 TaxID=1463896 RepID=UPI0004BFF749|nr:hypothetical protein [Streptomyces sp. NRRL S-241]